MSSLLSRRDLLPTRDGRREGASVPVGRTVLNVAVFCSIEPLRPEFMEVGERLGELIAEHGHTLVRGAVDKGLMSVVSGAARRNGARSVGIGVEHSEYSCHDVDELIVVPDIAARKALMLGTSDAIISLPGGIGTLDEITAAIELRRHGLLGPRTDEITAAMEQRRRSPPIAMVNTDGFYDGLQSQLVRMQQEGMLTMALGTMVDFSPTPEAAMDYVNTFARA